MKRALIAAGIVAACTAVAVAGTFVGETPSTGDPVMGSLTESGASRFVRVYNTINDGGTESTLGVTLRASAGSASREVGTATVPLRVDPVGTTAQTVTGTGTAGTAATGVVTVQGIASGVAQPISAAALPLPSGAATETTLGTVNTSVGTVNTSVGTVNTSIGTLTTLLGVSTPAGTTTAITANDSTVLACSAVWVGTGGNVYVRGLNDAGCVAFLSVPDGSLLPVRAIRVCATGPTTATNMVCLAP